MTLTRKAAMKLQLLRHFQSRKHANHELMAIAEIDDPNPVIPSRSEDEKVVRTASGLIIYSSISVSPIAENLVVFMPSAISPRGKNSRKRIYSRFSWAEDFPKSNVLCLADPAREAHPEVLGAWYIDPDYDVISEIGNYVSEVAQTLNIPQNRIVIYGSSLGGFGAIALASLIPGAKALAEVPQIDVRNWISEAISDIETHITHSSLSDYSREFPEQLSLQARLIKSSYIPEFRMISNIGDRSYNDQLELLRWCHDSELPKGEEQALLLTSKEHGHKPLSRNVVSEIIKQFL